MQPLSSAFQPFGAAWWRALGERVVLETKKLADKGQGYGGKWKPYTAAYAAHKGAGDFKRQESQQIAPPNLELTGDTWRDFKVIQAENDRAEVGSIAYGLRLWGNEERGRAVFGPDGPAKPVQRLIDASVRRKMGEQLDKTRGTVRLRVGKR